jgi:DNA-binding CsgD family transcriptional regulator
MDFLTAEEIAALEAAIRQAREEGGIHRKWAGENEVFAYRFNEHINWVVKGGAHNKTLAQGTAPLSRTSYEQEIIQEFRPDCPKDVAELGAQLVDYAAYIGSLVTPDAVLDSLHDITSPALKLSVLGAVRFPLNVSDWGALRLGKTVFLHKGAPAGWWEEWLRRAPTQNPAGYLIARMSIAPCTWGEVLRLFGPIGTDRWGFELAMKYGMNDGFMCPIGGRWLITFHSERALAKVLVESLRIMIFAAASFAAMRLEQLVELDSERDGAYTRLSPRELAIVRLLSWGKSPQEIAEALGLEEETVKSQSEGIGARLGARNEAHAVAQAMRQRLVI